MDSKQLDKNLKDAEAAFATGDVVRAKEIYSNVLEQDPQQLEAAFGTAQCLFAMKEYNGAYTAAQYFITLSEDGVWLWDEYVSANIMSSVIEVANSGGKDGRQLDGLIKEFGDNHFYTSRKIASTLATAGLHELAVPYAETVSRYPRTPQDHLVCAQVYYGVGREEDAEKALLAAKKEEWLKPKFGNAELSQNLRQIFSVAQFGGYSVIDGPFYKQTEDRNSEFARKHLQRMVQTAELS